MNILLDHDPALVMFLFFNSRSLPV